MVQWMSASRLHAEMRFGCEVVVRDFCFEEVLVPRRVGSSEETTSAQQVSDPTHAVTHMFNISTCLRV